MLESGPQHWGAQRGQDLNHPTGREAGLSDGTERVEGVLLSCFPGLACLCPFLRGSGMNGPVSSQLFFSSSQEQTGRQPHRPQQGGESPGPTLETDAFYQFLLLVISN